MACHECADTTLTLNISNNACSRPKKFLVLRVRFRKAFPKKRHYNFPVLQAKLNKASNIPITINISINNTN